MWVSLLHKQADGKERAAPVLLARLEHVEGVRDAGHDAGGVTLQHLGWGFGPSGFQRSPCMAMPFRELGPGLLRVHLAWPRSQLASRQKRFNKRT